MRLARVTALSLTVFLAGGATSWLAGCSAGAGGAAAPSGPTAPKGTAAPTGTGAPTGTAAPTTLTVTSAAFTDGATIPAEDTCAGAGRMPPLAWSGDLRGASAIAVVVDDPDAPSGTFVHLVVVDLPATATTLGDALPAGAHYARNSAGRPGWTPPCPPSGTHHYRFTVYGLRSPTGLADGAAAADAEAAINARAVAQGRLVGLVSH